MGVLAAGALLGGCAGPTLTVPTDVAATIVVGKTTLADLRRALGAPSAREPTANGASVSWWQLEESTFGAAHARRLVVEVSPSGVVRSFDYQSTVPGEVP